MIEFASALGSVFRSSLRLVVREISTIVLMLQLLAEEGGRVRTFESDAPDLVQRNQTGGRLGAPLGAQPRRHLREPGPGSRR